MGSATYCAYDAEGRWMEVVLARRLRETPLLFTQYFEREAKKVVLRSTKGIKSCQVIESDDVRFGVGVGGKRRHGWREADLLHWRHLDASLRSHVPVAHLARLSHSIGSRRFHTSLWSRA